MSKNKPNDRYIQSTIGGFSISVELVHKARQYIDVKSTVNEVPTLKTSFVDISPSVFYVCSFFLGEGEVELYR